MGDYVLSTCIQFSEPRTANFPAISDCFPTSSNQGNGQIALKAFDVDVIKGWTRVTCVAFFALAVADLDLSDPQVLAMLKPMEGILDKAWLIPMHAAWLNKCKHL